METLSNLREFYKINSKGSGTKGTKSRAGLTSNVEYISTDLSMRYLGLLLSEFNENGYNYILTDSVTVPDNTDKSIRKAVELFIKTYESLLDSDGIYTVINISPKEFSESHQNWIAFFPKEGLLVRYEPNGTVWAEKNRNSFRVNDILEEVAEHFDASLVFSSSMSINKFSGCRATSTILVLLDLIGIDLSVLSKVKDFRALAIALSDEIRECDLPLIRASKTRSKRVNDRLELIVKP